MSWRRLATGNECHIEVLYPMATQQHPPPASTPSTTPSPTGLTAGRAGVTLSVPSVSLGRGGGEVRTHTSPPVCALLPFVKGDQ